jgi:hypothetical protein
MMLRNYTRDFFLEKLFIENLMLGFSLKVEHTLHQWMWGIKHSRSSVYLSIFHKNGQCVKENKKFVGMHQVSANMHIGPKKKKRNKLYYNTKHGIQNKFCVCCTLPIRIL